MALKSCNHSKPTLIRALAVDEDALKQDKDLEIPIRLISEALKISYNDPSYDLDDAEMIAACLIDQV